MAEERKDVQGAIGEFIRSQRERARLSLRQLAGLAKVSNAYLSQIERGVYRPSAKVLQALSRALDVSAETLYVKAGLLDEAGPAPDVVEAIRRDPNLTDDQRDALLSVYRGFVSSARGPERSA